jgi:1-acyl-sn-glycerol-3-phosphate acyltransferase
MPQTTTRRRPFFHAIAQDVVRWFFRISFTVFYRIRTHGLKNFPAEDGFLLCANHQSFLDPLVLGVACPRPVNYLGRKSLFRFRPLGWFLTWNDTIAIDRDASGIGGIKETLRRLKRGESVVMFPEGTRTHDGEVQPLKLGFCQLARRSKAPLFPVAFEGPFQSYSKHSSFPLPGRVHVVMGQPIPFDEYESLTDGEMAELLRERILGCFETARKHWQNGRIG